MDAGVLVRPVTHGDLIHSVGIGEPAGKDPGPSHPVDGLVASCPDDVQAAVPQDIAVRRRGHGERRGQLGGPSHLRELRGASEIHGGYGSLALRRCADDEGVGGAAHSEESWVRADLSPSAGRGRGDGAPEQAEHQREGEG